MRLTASACLQLMKAAKESAQIDNSRMAGRKLVIEKKKEEQERLLLQAEREEEEKRLVQERQTLAAEEERRRVDRCLSFTWEEKSCRDAIGDSYQCTSRFL